jgi:hypothetical protein
MRNKSFILDPICFIIALFFYYEGLYLLTRQDAYRIWIRHLPFAHFISESSILGYLIPLVNMAFVLLIILPSGRMWGLRLSLISSLGFILYLMFALLFTPVFFLPFHAYWSHMRWFDKMLFLLGIAWLSFIAMLLKKTA